VGGGVLDAGPGKLALFFPGQVSQYLDRSKRLHELSLSAWRVFAQAGEAVSFPLVASLLRSAS
jgi:malonyl CoA-acyl carrier protein transacylase